MSVSARGGACAPGACVRACQCAPFQEMPSVQPVHNQNPLSTSPGWEEAPPPPLLLLEATAESKPDMSAALQMGLGAALAGELSGDWACACERACGAVWGLFFPPSLLAPHFPPSLPASLSLPFRLAFPPRVHACPGNGIARPFLNYL